MSLAESLHGDWIPADTDAARGSESSSGLFLYYRLKRYNFTTFLGVRKIEIEDASHDEGSIYYGLLVQSHYGH